MPGGWYLEHGEKDPTIKIIVGVVAIGALALGAVMLLDDDKGNSGDSTGGLIRPTVSATADTPPADTPPADSTVPSTVVPSTSETVDPQSITSADLVAAMPTPEETPTGWERWREPRADPPDDEGGAYCDQPSAIERAREHALRALAWGPAYDLPQGGWFSFDVYTFRDADGATAFMRTIADDANLCTDAPISYTELESDVDFMDEAWGDFVWTVQEASAASNVSVAGDEAVMRATVQMRYSADVKDTALAVNETLLLVYRQYGRTVVEYWVGGNWGFTGLESLGEPEWAHQPVQAELDDAVAVVEAQLLARLRELGAA